MFNNIGPIQVQIKCVRFPLMATNMHFIFFHQNKPPIFGDIFGQMPNASISLYLSILMNRSEGKRSWIMVDLNYVFSRGKYQGKTGGFSTFAPAD